uniref:Histidine kinase 1 n=1 Tax=Lygus hesperus TaxID=30085 RepID=A0A0A9Y3X4_LYGHE
MVTTCTLYRHPYHHQYHWDKQSLHRHKYDNINSHRTKFSYHLSRDCSNNSYSEMPRLIPCILVYIMFTITICIFTIHARRRTKKRKVQHSPMLCVVWRVRSSSSSNNSRTEAYNCSSYSTDKTNKYIKEKMLQQKLPLPELGTHLALNLNINNGDSSSNSNTNNNNVEKEWKKKTCVFSGSSSKNRWSNDYSIKTNKLCRKLTWKQVMLMYIVIINQMNKSFSLNQRSVLKYKKYHQLQIAIL